MLLKELLANSINFNRLQKILKPFKKINNIVNAKKWYFSQKFAADKKVLNPFSHIERKNTTVIVFFN